MQQITPGTLLVGRYLVAEKLGIGGNGAVWSAHDRVLERSVAVKVVTGGAGAARLGREARTTARLDAREIVAIYDHGEQDGAHFLVMELVEGTDLAALLVQTGGLPTPLVALIGRDLARGLAAMHEAGLVHRDMTPANVLLSATGEVKLTDLGIARGVDDDDVRRLTEVGTIVGTVDYLAPEQLEDSQVVAATDVYALGLLLHHASTGQTPFGDGSVSERIARRVARDPAPLPDGMGTSRELAAIVARATRRTPADRYPDGASLAAALSGLVPVDDQPLRGELSELVAAAIASRSEQQATTVIVTPPAVVGEDADANEAPDAATAPEPVTDPPAAAGTLVLDIDDGRFDTGIAATTAIAIDGPTTAVAASSDAARSVAPTPAPTEHVDWDVDSDVDQDEEHPWTWVAVVAGSIAVLVALLLPAIQGGGDGEGGPAAEAPATLVLPIADAADHDPLGGGDEHPEDVGLAIDGNAETEWDTEGYDSVDLGGLKSGVGLLIDLGQAADVGAVEIDLGSAGVDLTVLVSAERPSGDPLSEATPLGAATGAEGTVRLEGGPINGRWVSLWFTRLGDGPGRARAAVREVRVLAPEG